MIRKSLFSVAVVGMVAGLVAAAEFKSGPQPGDKFPGAFHPLNVTGDAKGEKQCLVCKNGANPVAMVFARTPDCEMTAKLLKRLDEVTIANEKADMGSFAVYLTDDDKAKSKLEALEKKEGLRKLILAIDNPAGPEKYNVSKDADLTVTLYVKNDIKASYAFKKGEITDKDIEKIVKDVSKIVPAK
ncbi:MAG TPA: hypothetical protein VGJ05_05335 [Fimbriiglobus sp.]|jgi:hypothetical protein